MKRTAYCNVAPQEHDRWPIKKALTYSDVDVTHPFLTLSRQQVESHILAYMTPQQQEHLRAEGEVGFNAEDDDTGKMSAMRLKWRGSYYNLIGKWGKVVRGKGLEVGQEINLQWLNGCLHYSVPQHEVDAVPPMRMVPSPVTQGHWPIRRILTPSDVDPQHPFLPLPRKSVEDHILAHWVRERLREDEQVSVEARDYDTGDAHSMKLKWCGNYYHLLGKWASIIRQKRLGVGKEVRLRWENNCLYFSVAEEQQVDSIDTACVQDNWPIKKTLTFSDVDTNHPFLTLPSKAVEDHILFYWTRQAREELRCENQVGIDARDGDTGDSYSMKLKWRGSYYDLIGKWGKVIRERSLLVGREMRLRWDNGCLIFSVAHW